MHEESIKEKIFYCLDALLEIQIFFEDLHSAEDFVKDVSGKKTYAAICMKLQVFGENLKKIDKIDSSFIIENIGFYPDEIIRFREIISHHYELLDYQIIFRICNEEVTPLINKFQSFLSNSNEKTV